MNHAQIATEALRYRSTMMKGPVVDDRSWDIDAMAAVSVSAADPVVDSAIRQIATAWMRAGLDQSDLVRPWVGPDVDRLFTECPDLVDLLDDIVRVASRVHAA